MPRHNKGKKGKTKKSKKNSKGKKRSFFKLFTRSKKKSSKSKSSKSKSSKGKSSKRKSTKKKSPMNNIVFTVSERKPNSNKNKIIHQRLIPNSPLLQLESLLLRSPVETKTSSKKQKTTMKTKKNMNINKNPYPNYLNTLLQESQEPHRLSPNIFMIPTSNPSYQSQDLKAQVIPKSQHQQPEHYKRVETSTFTSQNVNGNVSKSGVKVISDSRNPKSHLFTLQDNHLTHEMVNHAKIDERVKRATKKMSQLKKKSGKDKLKSRKYKIKQNRGKPLIIQKYSEINF